MAGKQDLLEALVGPVVPAKRAEPVRALAWARVSTDMQEERGLSIPQQFREIRDYAESHGIEVVEEFSETASAYRREAKRVEFRRMVSRAKAERDVAAILVHDYSRFSRDSTRAKSLVRELGLAGVKVVSLNDPEFDSESVAGVYMEAITFAKNEAYSREVAFHTRKGCRANAQARDPETGGCYKNGGQPLWGYRTKRVQQGTDKRGRPRTKSVWVLDDAAVAGKPAHEWVRHCLVELAANGASLDELRDFCNGKGIPARRKRYWSTSTWYSLLQPNVLLQYCGFGVWNVHRKNGTKRPPTEWLVVENAHPPIITEDEAKAIAEARRRRSGERRFDPGFGTSRKSCYLLSGGLFKCGRCGSNMIGLRRTTGRYYVCGSQPYRRGMGCGPGVYVPQDRVESEVLKRLEVLLARCTDSQRFARMVNGHLKVLWRDAAGRDVNVARRMADIDAKVANIRQAIEDGLSDAAWANARLEELLAERRVLEEAESPPKKPPKVAAKQAKAYLSQMEKVLAQGEPPERKRVIRAWVAEMKLAPERLEVEITYRIPEPIVNDVVAGAGFDTDPQDSWEWEDIGLVDAAAVAG